MIHGQEKRRARVPPTVALNLFGIHGSTGGGGHMVLPAKRYMGVGVTTTFVIPSWKSRSRCPSSADEPSNDPTRTDLCHEVGTPSVQRAGTASR